MKRILAAFVALAGLVLAQAAAAQDVVHLGNLRFAHYGAISYMKEIAAKHGLKIEEQFFAKGIDITPAIVAGSIDIAASAVDAAIAGRAQGVPTYVVAGFARGGARLVVGKSSGISSIEGMKGHKVGVTRGGAQELLLLAEFAKHGLTWSDRPGRDVQLFYMGFPELNQALQAGDIDAISQSEPQASQAINQGYGVELMKPYDTELGAPIRALVMTEKMYKERPDVAQRVLDCFVEATQTFIDHPDLAQKYVRENMFHNQITAQDYLDAIGNSPFTFEITVQHVQVTTDLMQRFGVGRMTAPPAAADWVKLDLLQNAVARLKKS